MLANRARIIMITSTSATKIWLLLRNRLPGALHDDIDPGLHQRGGALFEENLGHLPSVSTRDLKALSPSLLGEDGERNAQGRLAKLVLGLGLCAPVDEQFDDVRQSLIGGVMKRGPAKLADRIHV